MHHRIHHENIFSVKEHINLHFSLFKECREIHTTINCTKNDDYILT